MGDHTSAVLFSDLFKMLAKNPTPEHKKMAKKIANWSKEFDFSYDEMHADTALKALDLQHLIVRDDYDGEE